MTRETHTTPTEPTFGARLGQIRRTGSQLRARHRRDRMSDSRRRSERMLAALDLVDGAEALVAGLARDLAETLAADVRSGRRLFEGRYELSLRLTERLADGGPRVDGRPSRIAVLLEPRPFEGRFVVECRRTAHDRDLPRVTLTEPIDEATLQRLRAPLEQLLLEFSEAWCAGAEARPGPSSLAA